MNQIKFDKIMAIKIAGLILSGVGTLITGFAKDKENDKLVEEMVKDRLDRIKNKK